MFKFSMDVLKRSYLPSHFVKCCKNGCIYICEIEFSYKNCRPSQKLVCINPRKKSKNSHFHFLRLSFIVAFHVCCFMAIIFHVWLHSLRHCKYFCPHCSLMFAASWQSFSVPIAFSCSFSILLITPPHFPVSILLTSRLG